MPRSVAHLRAIVEEAARLEIEHLPPEHQERCLRHLQEQLTDNKLQDIHQRGGDNALKGLARSLAITWLHQYPGNVLLCVSREAASQVQNNPSQSEDLAQIVVTCFLEQPDLKRKALLDNPLHLRNWMHLVAKQRNIDRWKREHRTQSLGEDCQPLTESSPDEPLLAAEEWELLLMEVQNLPQDQREVVQLRYFEDRPVAEIGRRLNRSSGSVYALLVEARSTLSRRLLRRRHIPTREHP